MAKAITTKELRKMNVTDLTKECRDSGQKLAKMRLDMKLGKHKNTAEYQQLKKDCARMQTILTEQRLLAASEDTSLNQADEN